MPKQQPPAVKPPPTGDAPGPDEQPAAAEQAEITEPEAEFEDLTSLQDSDEYIKGLWWGQEGAGKTTDVLTAANYGRVLSINAEGGIKKKPLRELGVNLENVTPWPDPKSGVEITYATMENLHWRIKARLMAEPGYFFAVCWDSASRIYDKMVADVRAYEFERNKRKPEGKQIEARKDPFFTDIAYYGVATEQMRHLLRLYHDLPCHFLVTALERRDIDPDTAKVAYGPGVGPAFQKDLLGYLDVVLATKASTLQIGPDEEVDVIDSFRALTRSNGRSRAKDRFKSLPRVFAVPTFERVLDYVEDRLTEATDPVQAEWLQNRKIHQQYEEGTPQDTDGETTGAHPDVKPDEIDAEALVTA